MAAIAASDKKKYKYLGDGNSDGSVLGDAPADLVGMYGFTPVSQAASIAALDVSASDTTDYNANFVLVNTLITDLEALGILASD